MEQADRGGNPVHSASSLEMQELSDLCRYKDERIRQQDQHVDQYKDNL